MLLLAKACSDQPAAPHLSTPSPHALTTTNQPTNRLTALQVFEGTPATVAELAAVEEDLTAGAMQADVITINQRPLELQLLQVSIRAHRVSVCCWCQLLWASAASQQLREFP